MKIHEIISESVDEGIISKAISGLAKMGGKKEAIKQLAQTWASEYAKYGKYLSRPQGTIAKEFATDPAVIKAAKEESRKLIGKATRKAAIGNVTGAIGKTVYVGEKGISALVGIGMTVTPIYTYNKRMAHWEKQLESGQIDQDTFDSLRQKEMSVMVASMAANLVGYAGIKSLGAATKWIPGLGTATGLLTSYGAAQAGMWMNSDEGREMIAMVAASDIAGLDISPLLGGVPLAFIDKFKSLIPGWNKQPAGTAAQPSTGTTANIPAGQSGAPAGTTTAAPKPPAGNPTSTGIMTGTNAQSVDTGNPEQPFSISFK